MKNIDRAFFYEDFENTEFFSRGFDLYRRTPKGEFKFFTVQTDDNPTKRDAFIAWVREHEHFAVILLDWEIKRNILVFDKTANKLLYQLHDPKNVFSSRPNSWVNIYIEDNGFIAKSVDSYCELIRYHDGKVLEEMDPRRNDPRDF